jgi:hypothetical protein
LVDPAEEGFARRAAELFHRDGFVLIKDCLDEARQQRIRLGCDQVICHIVAHDPHMLGSRGSHRYAFGTAPSHCECAHNWAALIDPPPVLAAVEQIFESPLFRCSGYGGDFVLPGCVEFQHLHRDMGDYLNDPNGRLTFLDMPCAQVVVNYPIVVGEGDTAKMAHTTYNGATRQIPGTQQSHQPIPPHEVEPLWMKLSTTAPAPAGCAMLRDVRAWHGGTPNLSRDVRAIPSVTFTAPWFSTNTATNSRPRSLPRCVFQTLSARGQAVAADIVCEDDAAPLEWVPDWDNDKKVGGGGGTNASHRGLQVGRL